MRNLQVVSLDRATDAAEVAEVPPDHECLAHYVALRHEAPVAAVAAAVAVIPHHEVMARGNRAHEALLIVFTILAMRKLPDLRQLNRHIAWIDQDLMLVTA